MGVKVLHGYVFREVLTAAALAVGVFAFVLLAGNVIRDILGLLAAGRLNGALFVQLLLLLIPYVVAYALPLGLLSGILVVLGRMSAQREITAMRAAGVSVWSLSAPILLLAFVGVLFSVFINFEYAPSSRTDYRQRLGNLLREDPVRLLEPGVFIRDFPGYVLYVGERRGGVLSDFWIWELDEVGRVRVFARAREGVFAYDREGDAIVLTLLGAVAEKRDSQDPEDFVSGGGGGMLVFEEARVRLPLSGILGGDGFSRKLSMLTLRELLALRQSLLREGASERDLVRVQLQVQKNFAHAFAVFSLALLAIPLGIRASRSETYANWVLALLLALGYYVATMVVTWLEGKPQWRPDLLVWMPNVVIQSLGLWLLGRVGK